MTPLQVFLAYAKIRGIIPSMHRLAIYSNWKIYLYNPANGQYSKSNAMFKDIFKNHFSNDGFGNTLFVSLLYQYPNGDNILRKPDVEKAHRKWTTFVNNNIIYDGNVKIGDRVKYKWWNAENTGEVVRINRDFSRIEVKRDDGSYVHLNPGCVLEVEGKPVEFSFHIKWKGKEYGKKDGN